LTRPRSARRLRGASRDARLDRPRPSEKESPCPA
jgi:hypothetical protein